METLILGLADIKVEEEWFLQISFEGLIWLDACGNTSEDGGAPHVCGVRWGGHG